MKKFFIRTALLSLVVSSKLFALELGKPVIASVPITKPELAAAGKLTKQISLLNFQFTAKEKEFLFSYIPKKLPRSTSSDLPEAMDVGMNGVPVLDQGEHGTCTTFANTAAIDAIMGNGDYVSQLCNLELGAYLSKYGYRPSGWDGSMGPWILDQMMRFGVVNKTNQRNKACGNMTEYPLNTRNNSKPLALTQFKKVSEDITDMVYPVYLTNWAKRFNNKLTAANNDDESLITDIKTGIAYGGDRLTLGFSLVMNPKCTVGACATHHVKHDTWALTKEVNDPHYDILGHEILITAYDDNAEAVDEDGNIHKGLLTLRNSWSADVGDEGNFYMTYDYLEKFVVELQLISQIVSQK